MLNAPSASSVQTQLNHCHYINLVSYAILYYDYALTFPDEVHRFWTTKTITWASFLFYLNRYVALFGHIPVIVQYYWHSSASAAMSVIPCRQNCPSLASFHQYFAVAIQVIVGILLILRTYALYDQNKWVLLGICLVALGVIIFGTWTVTAGARGTDTDGLPVVGCIPPLSRSDANRLAAAWTGNLMFDVMIFSMTVYKSMKQIKVGDRTLINILLRDGAIYFGIMAVVGAANIISFHLSPEYERGFITTFANVISSTMISRLMLNLRDPRLYPRYRVKAVRNPGTADVPVLSTVFEFNTMHTTTTTDQGWQITNDTTIDTQVATNSIEVVSRTSQA